MSDFVQIDKVNAGDAKSDIMLKGPDGNLEATVSVDDKNNLGLESEYVRLQAEKQLAKKVEEQIKSGQPHDKDALEYLLSEETEHYKQYGESFPYLKEVKPSKKSDEGTTAQTGKGDGAEIEAKKAYIERRRQEAKLPIEINGKNIGEDLSNYDDGEKSIKGQGYKEIRDDIVEKQSKGIISNEDKNIIQQEAQAINYR